MAQNFKTTECDEIFGVNSIKACYAGASLKEINDNLNRAFSANEDINLVIRGLDGVSLRQDKNLMRYKSYPTYLTDDYIFNDVNYLLNKEIFLSHTIKVPFYTLQGNITTTFDEYSNWNRKHKFGKEIVLKKYTRPKKTKEKVVLSDELKERTRENIIQNVVDLASQNPDVDFYYFFTPYSILYWDKLNQLGELDMYIETHILATELMLQYENIHLFSFYDKYDIVTNLDIYKDEAHYNEEINTKILKWMKNGEHQLTKDNYKSYWDKIYTYYSKYDYDSLFEN